MPSISYEIYRCFTGQVFYSINHELLRYKRRTPVKSFLFHGVNHVPLVANEGQKRRAPPYVNSTHKTQALKIRAQDLSTSINRYNYGTIIIKSIRAYYIYH